MLRVIKRWEVAEGFFIAGNAKYLSTPIPCHEFQMIQIVGVSTDGLLVCNKCTGFRALEG